MLVMPKKKEVPMPKLDSKKILAKKKVVYYSWIAVIVSVVGLFCLALWSKKESKKETVEYIQKGTVTNYVCKIVGADPDEEVVAVQCYTQ